MKTYTKAHIGLWSMRYRRRIKVTTYYRRMKNHDTVNLNIACSNRDQLRQDNPQFFTQGSHSLLSSSQPVISLFSPLRKRVLPGNMAFQYARQNEMSIQPKSHALLSSISPPRRRSYHTLPYLTFPPICKHASDRISLMHERFS